MEINNKYSRRRFIRTLTCGTGALVLARQLASLASCFPNAANKKSGTALVGLGDIVRGNWLRHY